MVTATGYQSDVIADLIQRFHFPFISLNPGASFRGLHDSLVNHNHNEPPMLLCQHEKIAVQIAHGYAKVTGTPMVAIVHDVVGMLHAVMGIYYAYLDRAPVFVIGATGPMDEKRRRPWIDWIHTANVQGNALREFVKWDYQPGGIDGVPDSFARAYSIMMTEPRGPIYMCYDAWLQEAPLEEPIALPPFEAIVPTRIMPDLGALEVAADRLLQAEWPVLLPEFTGRVASGFDDLTALAEVLAAPVYDLEARLNFPTRHPLNLSHDKDVPDRRPGLTPTAQLGRRHGAGLGDPHHDDHPPHWLMTFRQHRDRKWATDYQRSTGRSALPTPRFDSGAIDIIRRTLAAATRWPRRSRNDGPSSRSAAVRCTQSSRRRPRRTGIPHRSACRGSPRRSGTRSKARIGCSPPTR